MVRYKNIFSVVAVAAIMLIPGGALYAQHVTVGGSVFGGGNLANVGGSSTVTINQTGATIGTLEGEAGSQTLKDKTGDVYGGGAKALVNVTIDGSGNASHTANTTTSVTLTAGTVLGNVYGGGLGYVKANDTEQDTAAHVYGPVTVTIEGGIVDSSVYGCNNIHGAPQSTVQVNIEDGTVMKDVYGGGNLANSPASPVVTIDSGTVHHDVYGGGALANVGGSTVNVTGGTIQGNVYGGGLGRKELSDGEGNITVTAIAAEVNGVVTVNIGAAAVSPSIDPTGDATIFGYVFGCNNTNGSPTDNVFVHIYKTHRETNQETSGTGFALSQVFGGGNQAHYQPTTSGKKTTVHVYTCDNTIRYLYGGGNAANVGTSGDGNITSATDVIIDGGRIEWVFGGGNGQSTSTFTNPGADIYGNTNVTYHAGKITYIFGGSNEKGNVSGTKTVDILADGTCTTKEIAELYGGSNMAPTTGDVSLTMGCSESTCEIGALYGGSRNADISGDVILTIEGGVYDKVFGGNNIGGTIYGDVTLNLLGGTINNAFGGNNESGRILGKITVNVLDDMSEDDSHNLTCPLVLHNVYGGGYDAPYNPTTVGNYPEVNIIHGTVSTKSGAQEGTTGNVFGGGYGATAVVNSNPKVTIGYVSNESINTLLHNINHPYENTTASLSATVANNVYGGGDLAAVAGSTTVTLQHANSSVSNLFGGGNQASVGNATVNINGGAVSTGVYGGCNTSGSVGGSIAPYTATLNTTSNIYAGPNTASTATSYDGDVIVNVTGGTIGGTARANIHGGGYGDQTATTGDITVTFGAQSTTHSDLPTLTGDLYGGSALGNVGATGSMTTVNVINGKIYGDVYGGGLGNNDHAAAVNGDVEVYIGKSIGTPTSTLYNTAVIATYTDGTVKGGNVFGCNNANGAPTGNVQVNINGSVGNNVFGGGNLAAYTGVPDVNIIAGTVSGSVFGGGNEAGVGGGDVAMTGGTVLTGIYGGCNTSGTVSGNIFVSLTGGIIGADGTPANVHGGGYGQATKTGGNVEVIINQQSGENPPAAPVIWGDVYGGSALGSVNSSAVTPAVNSTSHTYVTLTKGTVHGDIYGGGLGQLDDESTTDNETVEAKVWSPVQVTVNGGSVTGSVYGCNNVNGAPQSTVKVDIYGTDTPLSGYALANVFGGGNQAAYGATPEVTIHNCSNSIGYVYGGGNAASVVNTNVKVYGGNTIGYVFGGGNGEGVAANYTMVSGNAVAYIYGGTIGHVFGGNNSSGAITGTITVNIDKQTETGHSSCPMKIGEVYGGGNEAAGKAGTITIGCTGTLVALGSGEHYGVDQEGIRYVYGGANKADISNNIVLTINSGIIENVFGGNNTSGAISGTIQVDINKNNSASCASDWYVGNVFGGGNQATYGTVASNYPRVNILNGTVSYDVFGGGLGVANDATKGVVTGNPQVTVNGAGAAVNGGVYGGGSLAPTNGNPVVTLTNGALTNVYGGGKAANVVGNPTVNINGGTVSTGVYGGCNASGSVGAVTISLTGGTVGTDANNTADVYGGGYGDPTRTNGDITVTLSSTTIYGDLYGGSALGDVNASASNTTTIDINGGNLHGAIYGGGKGQLDPSITAVSNGNVLINYNTANSGLTGLYGGANIRGSVAGNINLNVLADVGASGAGHSVDIFGGGLGENTSTSGNVTVTVGNGSHSPVIYGDVYGGSSQGNVGDATTDLTTVSYAAGTIHGNIYGGGKGDASNTATTYGGVLVNINSNNSSYTNGIYGGANVRGNVKGDIEVNVLANVGVSGIRRDVFGGGLGAATQTEGNVTVTVGDQAGTSSPAIFGDVYGGSSLGSVNNDAADKTTVNILSGSLTGNVYGGGMGEAGADNVAKGQVNGEVEVNIGKKVGNNYYGSASFNTYTVSTNTKGGCVFGCNNTNGSPKGNVTVNIYKTAHGSGPANNEYPTNITTAAALATNASTQTYAIRGVFGGGNLASYTPDAVTGENAVPHNTTVHVYNCNNTIKDIFGGSNAANVGILDSDPDQAGNQTLSANTFIIIDGGRIHRVFGGGNGDPTPANIYGTATTSIHAGLIDSIFGGGNLLGSITESSLNIDKSGSCTDEVFRGVFGGANLAPLTGNVNTTIACNVETIDEVYGGSNKADIGTAALFNAGTSSDVTLNIEGGIIGSVFGGSKGTNLTAANIYGNVKLNLYGGTVTNAFGGSNTKGDVWGSIKVNVVDSGSCPLAVDYVYGGGNEAAYTHGGSAYPQVNVKNGTVSQNVYGGGKGTGAAVTGFPHVNIGDNTVASYVATVNGSVFGGGDAAAVTGNTAVVYNDTASASSVRSIYGGGKAADVSGNTSVILTDGAVDSVFGGCYTTGTVGGNAIVNLNGGTVGVSGTPANVVFGGGFGQPTRVSGDVEVSIDGATVHGSVYGGSALGNVNGTAVNTTNHTHVTLSNGTIHGDLYGGGLGQTSPSSIAAMVYSPVQVTVEGGTVENVYGCNNLNGAPQSTVQVTVNGGTVNQSLFGGGNQADYAAGTPLVTINDGTVKERIIGGGNAANVSQNTHIVIYGGTHGTGTGASRGVYGGCNMSGIVGGNAMVDILGGTFGTQAKLDLTEPEPYNIHGGGYGSSTVVNGDVTVNYGADDGTTSTASAYPKLYGDLYGGSALGTVNTNVSNTTQVNILNGSFGYKDIDMGSLGTVQYGGNIYGGGLGDATNTHPALVKGVIRVSIGAAPVSPATTPTGKADLRHCNVYGCNNAFGSPQENVYVDVYQTTHTTTDMADYEQLSGQPDPTFAIQNVFGGGNQAHYAPSVNPLDANNRPTKRAYTTIHYCDNTVENVYGGGNAADVIRAQMTVDGGRYKFIFAGGNGQITAANIGEGGVDIRIYSGRIGWYFEGCNMHGSIANGAANSVRATNGCTVGVDCPCEHTDLVIEYYYFGANMATIYGGLSNEVVCGGEKFEYKRVYAGSRLAVVYGNIELTVRGGKIGNLFGGCEGSSLISADVRKYPVDWQSHMTDGTYDAELISFLDSVLTNHHVDLGGQGGNITLRLEGGKLGNIYGGCDYRGNVEGDITIIVDSAAGLPVDCRLDIDYIYGGNNLARYAPDGTTPSPSRVSPLIELKNGHVNYDVYGGSKGGNPSHLYGNGEVISNPKVIVGDGVTGHTFRIGHIDRTDPANPVIYGDLHGGGSSANVKGNTEVVIQGTVDGEGNPSSIIEHNVFGGGKSGDVTGSTSVTIVPTN